MALQTRHGEKIDFRYNMRIYWNLLKKYKPVFITLIVLTIIVEALFIADKFLFKVIIDNATEFISGTLAQSAFIQILIWVLIAFAVIVVIRSAGKWLNVHILTRIDANLIYDLKEKFFNHIVSLDHNFHTTHKTGSLISRLGRGSSAIETMSDVLFFNFTILFINLVLVGASLAYFSPLPALVIVITAVAFIGYSFIIQNLQQESKIRFNRDIDIEKGMIADVFTNIDSIKYYGKERYIGNRYKKLNTKTKLSGLKFWDYFRPFETGQVLILGIGIFLLLYFPLVQFLNNQITLGTLVFIYTVFGQLVGPMFSFVWGLRGFYRAMADFQDLFQYNKHTNEIKDKPDAKNLKIKQGTVEFKNTTFKYGKRIIFKNFNLLINKNEKVALVGHSGSGKTTIIKLLNRLYDVDSGEILIDNQDIKDFTQVSLRSETGIVPQECILFDDTLYNNVKFSKPTATRKEVMTAIKFAQLDKIMKHFPKQENTIVGERGVRLSGGEKQRVSIARAILANKKILVLDEATSSLDSETEHEIQKDLKELLKGRTAIMIAHRLSTIMSADRIIVLKNGKIMQQGKHSELINQEGEYKKLWNLQKGGYIE
jgi:ATP-binding cassette subfamily B protein